MAKRRTREKRRRPVKIPSVYRYMALGLALPILVFVGMFCGYGYGQAYGDFAGWAFAALGSITGLLVSTVIIVEVVLYWDRKMASQLKPKERKHPRGARRARLG